MLEVGSGFEPLKAEPADLQSAPIGRSGNPPGSATCRGYLKPILMGNRGDMLRSITDLA